jgi:hypothetical protein
MSYEEILNEIYTDKEKAIRLFQKYDLESVIKKAIDLVKSKTAIDSQKPVRIGGLPTIMLHGVNSKLKDISDDGEKREVELLVSDIAFFLLNQLLQKTNGNRAELLIEVKESLQDACVIYNYNYEQLMLLFNLDKFAKIVSTVEYKSSSLEASHIPIHYEWLGKNHQLDELAKDLKSGNIIRSVKEFKSLFGVKPQAVQFNDAKIDYLIVLFDLLKEHKLISIKGNRGHLHPLKVHGVDFDNKVLIKNSPKSINYAIKKNPAKWSKITGICNQWIDGFKKQRMTLS